MSLSALIQHSVLDILHIKQKSNEKIGASMSDAKAYAGWLYIPYYVLLLMVQRSHVSNPPEMHKTPPNPVV